MHFLQSLLHLAPRCTSWLTEWPAYFAIVQTFKVSTLEMENRVLSPIGKPTKVANLSRRGIRATVRLQNTSLDSLQ